MNENVKTNFPQWVISILLGVIRVAPCHDLWLNLKQASGNPSESNGSSDTSGCNTGFRDD